MHWRLPSPGAFLCRRSINTAPAGSRAFFSVSVPAIAEGDRILANVADGEHKVIDAIAEGDRILADVAVRGLHFVKGAIAEGDRILADVAAGGYHNVNVGIVEDKFVLGDAGGYQ